MFQKIRVLCVCTLVLLACGCSTFGGSNDRFSKASSEGKGPVGEADGNPNFYYDFEDVVVPGEMKFQQDQSFIVETMSMKAGIMTFEGRIDSASLADFYRNNMGKDGWTLRSIFRSKRTILVFEKPNKDCVINIVDSTIDTLLEVWVAPRASGSSGRAPMAAPAPAQMPSTGNGAYQQMFQPQTQQPYQSMPGSGGRSVREQNLGN